MRARCAAMIAIVLLGGCGGATPVAATTPDRPALAGGARGPVVTQVQPAREPAAAWLPAEVVAVLHADVAQADRVAPLSQVLGELLGEARAQRALQQVKRLHVGVAMAGAEPQLTLVVEGTPPLPEGALREARGGREHYLGAEELWVRVGERLWLGCVQHACSQSLTDPTQRSAAQQVPSWALEHAQDALTLTVGIPRGPAGDELREYIYEHTPGVLEALRGGQLRLELAGKADDPSPAGDADAFETPNAPNAHDARDTGDAHGADPAADPAGNAGVRLTLAAEFDLASIADNAAIALRVLVANAADNLSLLGQREQATRLHQLRIGRQGERIETQLWLPEQSARMLAYALWAGYLAQRARTEP